MAPITPFQISIPDSQLSLLSQKLSLITLPKITIAEKPWTRGPPISDITRLLTYWQHTFDWREAEAQINATLPQFTTSISIAGFGDYEMHFVHQRSEVDQNAIPLLYLHGWPGSFLEVQKILPLLVKPTEDGAKTFHVVAPSLIDFGFSSGNVKEDFHIDQHAEACHNLMLALGYTEYIVQGGDIGSLVTRFIAQKYGPKHCKAHHLLGAVPAEPTALSHPDLHAKLASQPPTPSDLAGLARTAETYKKRMGYYHIQTTTPLTLSYSLADSPIGLLTWIYEKLHNWTDSYAWTDDEILTWVSIYYFSTAGPGASLNIFYANEVRKPEGAFAASQRFVQGVPLGISRFWKEVILMPRGWNGTLGEVVWEGVEHEKGGHFGAWENPEAVVGDLRGLVGVLGVCGMFFEGLDSRTWEAFL